MNFLYIAQVNTPLPPLMVQPNIILTIILAKPVWHLPSKTSGCNFILGIFKLAGEKDMLSIRKLSVIHKTSLSKSVGGAELSVIVASLFGYLLLRKWMKS